MSNTPPPMRARRARPPGFRSPVTGGNADSDAAAADEQAISRQLPPQRSPAFTTGAKLPLPDLHDARTRPVFVRAPDPLARWLELTLVGVREHRPRTTRQDIISALMLRYVRDTPGNAQHLIELLDDLERARARG